jgi:hypothetical protein
MPIRFNQCDRSQVPVFPVRTGFNYVVSAVEIEGKKGFTLRRYR